MSYKSLGVASPEKDFVFLLDETGELDPRVNLITAKRLLLERERLVLALRETEDVIAAWIDASQTPVFVDGRKTVGAFRPNLSHFEELKRRLRVSYGEKE